MHHLKKKLLQNLVSPFQVVFHLLSPPWHRLSCLSLPIRAPKGRCVLSGCHCAWLSLGSTPQALSHSINTPQSHLAKPAAQTHGKRPRQQHYPAVLSWYQDCDPKCLNLLVQETHTHKQQWFSLLFSIICAFVQKIYIKVFVCKEAPPTVDCI